MHLRCFTCVLIALGTFEITAQTPLSCPYSITGIVLDEHDAGSLGYATIYIPEIGRGVAADSAGNFIIPDICSGTYTLELNHVGCTPRTQTIKVDGDIHLVLHLEHHAELLETIELRADRLRVVASSARLELTREEIRDQSGKPFGELLSGLPGVSALQTGPNVFKPVIHGLHSNRILILRDGLRLESQQWGQDHAPEIDPNTAARITVVKGAAAVQYGAEALGGVVLVDAEELPTDQHFTGHAGITGIGNGRQLAVSASLARGLGKGFGIRAEGSVRRSGDLRAPDYVLTNTGATEAGMRIQGGFQQGLKQLKLSYEFFASELGILRSAHIGNLSDLEEALERDTPLIVEPFSYVISNPRQQVAHHTFLVSGQTYLKGFGVLRGQYAVQINHRQEFDLRRGGRDDLPALDLELTTQSASAVLTHDPKGRFHGNIGISWNYQQNRNIPGTGVKPLIPHYTRYTPAIAWIEKWTHEEIEIEGGLRYEYVWLQVKYFDEQGRLVIPEYEFNNYAASLGIIWGVGPDIKITSHLGFTRRAPQVHELYSSGLHHGAAAIEYGDSAIHSESSLKWISGIEMQTGRLAITASTFVQPVQDFIFLNPTGEPELTIRGAFPVFQYVQDDVLLYGGDARCDILLTEQFSWRTEFAFVRGKNHAVNESLFGMPSDRLRNSIQWTSPEHRITGEVGYTYTWKQSRVPAEGDFAPPPDGYGLLDLNATVQIIPDKLRGSLAVHNVLNTAYREYLNRLRYYADDIGRSIELRLQYQF